FCCQAEDGIRYWSVTGVQTCALPISCAQGEVMGTAERHRDAGLLAERGRLRIAPPLRGCRQLDRGALAHAAKRARQLGVDQLGKIGRASCRERAWRSGGAGSVRRWI